MTGDLGNRGSSGGSLTGGIVGSGNGSGLGSGKFGPVIRLIKREGASEDGST